MSTMKKEELEKLLAGVPDPVSQIEKSLGMPKTTLQKALKGTRGLSKKWSLALVKWVTYEEAPTTKRSELATAAVQMSQKTLRKVMEGQGSRPKTLDELRAMCPIDSGLNRTIWINEKREEYGI